MCRDQVTTAAKTSDIPGRYVDGEAMTTAMLDTHSCMRRHLSIAIGTPPTGHRSSRSHMWLRRYPHEQTDTHTHRRAHHNTLSPLPWEKS